MDWNERRIAARRRAVGKYDAAEAEAYGKLQGLGWLTADEENAYLADLNRVVQLAPGANVLDVGAGTGVMCSMLRRLPGIELTALRPLASWTNTGRIKSFALKLFSRINRREKSS